ncbi:MAG: N-acetylmuramoyl-L-alanine amidase [Candidatus Aminicenantes bacterium]|nr:N-acetylmuramoyl-L-alanine amidase [Candidatus Aminicenantes bacterium]
MKRTFSIFKIKNLSIAILLIFINFLEASQSNYWPSAQAKEGQLFNLINLNQFNSRNNNNYFFSFFINSKTNLTNYPQTSGQGVQSQDKPNQSSLGKVEVSKAEVYDLRSFTHPTHTRIVLDCSQVREYTTLELKEPDRLAVDVLRAQLNPILHGKQVQVQTAYLTKIRLAQRTPTIVRLTADLDWRLIERTHVFTLYDPFRIVIDIYPREGQAQRPVAESAEKLPEEKPIISPQPTKAGWTLARQLGLGVKTIVLDPGHGGSDPGCIGRSGLKEKDIVLNLAIDLKKKIQEAGFEVFLTRETDIFVPLENRTVIANQKKADIFISLHVNSHPNKNRSGIQTFYLNITQDSVVNELAALENATSPRTLNQMAETIRKIIRHSKALESRELAEKIQENLVKCLRKAYPDTQDLGVKGGPFWVLIGGEMPSVLIELSHMSNAKEEARLQEKSYQQLLIEGIFEGIIAYIKTLGKG